MTLENFIKFYSNFFPNGDASKFCKRVFKVFDTNRSGKIDFDELMLAISVNSLGNLEKKLTLAFQIYDLGKLIFLVSNIHGVENVNIKCTNLIAFSSATYFKDNDKRRIYMFFISPLKFVSIPPMFLLVSCMS